MEFELRLDPNDASRFFRLPLLATAVRSRPQVQRIVWHDNAEGVLTAQGLALARMRGLWRVEKLVPAATDVWPPGAPPPVLAEAADPAGLGIGLPAGLAPAAAFSGRRHSLALDAEHGVVMLTVTRGTLRAVTAEHGSARVHLSGDDRSVLALALALAGEVRLEVAHATLAAEALAVARAAVPAPRRQGASELPEVPTIPEAFAFVLAHLTDVVLHFAPAAADDVSGPEPVHHMRVALRRLRSAIKIFRRVLDCPESRSVADGLKALSARLGPTRDWDVFLGETMPGVRALFPNEPRLSRLAVAADRQRRECHAALRAFLASLEFRRLGIELAWLASARSWYPPAVPADAEPLSLQEYAADMLERRWDKLQGIDDLRSLDQPAMHAVRLKAKQARYAAEIFAPLYVGKAPHRFIHRLTQVQDGLGKLNDRATAEHLLAALGGARGRHAYAVGLVLGVSAASIGDLRPRVIRRWEKFGRTGKFWKSV